MTTEKRLVYLYSNGKGQWFAKCYWCHCSTASHDSPDDLRILADAKKKDWRIEMRGDGQYRLTCDTCVRRGR